MRCGSLILLACTLFANSAFASSYLTNSGSVVDPILALLGAPHSYSGPNLERFAVLTDADLNNAALPDANLENADLTRAILNDTNLEFANLSNANLSDALLINTNVTFADLTGAKLTGTTLSDAKLAFANLTFADLTGALLFNADLQFATLTSADLTGADLSGANLSNAFGLSSTVGAALYDTNTDFTSAGFDPVAAGWILLPEPSKRSLMNLALVVLIGLGRRKRAVARPSHVHLGGPRRAIVGTLVATSTLRLRCSAS